MNPPPTPTVSKSANRLAIGACLLAMMLAGAGCDLFRKNDSGGGWFGGGGRASQPTDRQIEMLDQAERAVDAGEYEAALSLFEAVLAENPTITTAHLGIADIYVIKEDYAKAEPYYGRAAKLEPRNFDAHFGHGLALQMLNRFIEALRAYHRALTLDPESVKANLNIATTYLQMDEPQSAITFAERAVQLDGSNASSRINLGAAYERVGRNKDAIEQYLVAMELVEPQHAPPLMMNLIGVLSTEKRYQEAANVAENLVKTEPSANAYERLGWCAFRLGEFEKSIEAYREAVRIDPQHWQSHNGIGVNALNTWLLSKKRDEAALKEARDSLRRSLQLNQDQPKLIMLMSNHGL